MYRILFIEDDQTISAIMCEWLNKWNLEAVAVQDSKKVLETVSEAAPHLILLDLGLDFPHNIDTQDKIIIQSFGG